MELFPIDYTPVQPIREAIYRGPGYYVIRNFLDAQQAAYLLQFWQSHHNPVIDPYDKWDQLYLGCPDSSTLSAEVDRHYNFFWNPPLDMFSYTTGWRLQALRNRIEGNPPNKDFLPHFQRYRKDPNGYYGASYRVTLTKYGAEVPRHVDYPLDHARVQLSLALTSYGDDYTGGFYLENGLLGGEPINLCAKEQLRAGDLLIFRYFQPHGVYPIATRDNQPGYARILMPPEAIALHPGGLRPQLAADSPRPDYDDTPYREGGRLYYGEEAAQLMDIAVHEGYEPAEVFFYRGLWARHDQFRDWPFEALRAHGLQPHHQVLDIGCGFGKLAMRLVDWLEDDHYCGIDPVPGYIHLAEIYLQKVSHARHRYQLLCDGEFAFERFARRFDFAMAHSVFTHLSFQQIEQCLRRLQTVMQPGGSLLFTVCIGGEEREEHVVYGNNIPMIKSYHRDLSFYATLAERLGIVIEALEQPPHPTQQVCLARF